MTDTVTDAPAGEQLDSVQPSNPTPNTSTEAPNAADAQPANGSENTGAQNDNPNQEPNPDKKQGGYNKRIAELTYKTRQAERERDAERAEKADLKRRLEEFERTKATQTPEGAQPEGEFDENAAYDKVTSEILERITSQQKQDAEQAQRAELQTKAVDFVSGLSDQETVDYLSRSDNGISDQAAEIMLSIDPSRAEAIARYLAHNFEASEAIAKLPPHRQVSQLYEFERALAEASPAQTETAQTSAPSQRVSSAPAPAPTLSGKGSTGTDPSKMTADQWIKWREKQVRNKA